MDGMGFFKRLVCVLPVVWGTAFTGPAWAQATANSSLTALPTDGVQSAFSAMESQDKAWKALAAAAELMGYTPTIRWWNPTWSRKAAFNNGGQSVTFTWRVFDLDNIRSPDAGALFYVSDGNHTYRDLVVAVNRDPQSIREYTVEGTEGNYRLVPTGFFEACLDKAFSAQCVRTCGEDKRKDAAAGAILVTGVFSWSTYLSDLVSGPCGDCVMEQAWHCLR